MTIDARRRLIAPTPGTPSACIGVETFNTREASPGMRVWQEWMYRIVLSWDSPIPPTFQVSPPLILKNPAPTSPAAKWGQESTPQWLRHPHKQVLIVGSPTSTVKRAPDAFQAHGGLNRFGP